MANGAGDRERGRGLGGAHVCGWVGEGESVVRGTQANA